MARAVCPRCERPLSTCLCATLPAPPLAHRTELLVLQHPAEAGHAKNTAVLLALGLQSVRLLRGEAFDAGLAGPGTALLYPAEGAATAAAPRDVKRHVLLALPAQPGRYALRRAHRPEQLSTLEAGLHALALLEGGPAPLEPLWAAFDAFVQAGLYRRETGMA
jgi:DTW domain-containing protein YfiP